MTFLVLLIRLLFELTPMPEPARQPKPKPYALPQTVTFANDVQPILERRCTPCHFTGGVMHAKLPFDRGETIQKLGTKLFTRIKKDDEQRVIRAYLAGAATAPATRAP